MLLKKDIEERRRKEKAIKNTEPSYEENFIDKTRNVGVVLGEKDIKQDVKEKMGKNRKHANSLTDIENDHEALCQRGNQLMRTGDYKAAINLFNKSVIAYLKNPNYEELDPEPYIARSKCSLRLGLVEEAVEDACEALANNKHSIPAMKAKADAMYQFGEFEQALVQYERGLRICSESDLVHFQRGKTICLDTLLTAFEGYKFEHDLVRFTINAVVKLRPEGEIDPRKNFFNCDEMEQIVKVQSRDSNKTLFYKTKKEKQVKRKKPDNLKSPVKKPVFKKKTNRQIMGKLLDDAIFLEKLSKHPEFGNISFDPSREREVEDTSGRLMKNHALEAVVYFEKKKEFWNECSKMKPTVNWGVKNE